MADRGSFSRTASPGPEVRIEQVTECPVSFHRYLYREVGRHHHWIDRLSLTDQEIRSYLDDEHLSVWVMYTGGSPAGYFELLSHEDGAIEIAYIGLLPEFIGRGLGKYLLEEALSQAWERRPVRVWLHTCTLDGPAALPNYLRRGFKPFKQEKYETVIAPDEELHCAI